MNTTSPYSEARRNEQKDVRSQYTSLLLLMLAAVLLPVGLSFGAQQEPSTTDRDRGIKLYKHGDAIGASEALRAAVKRHKEDITAWYYLGLALEQRGDSNSARKAYEQATKLGDILLNKQLDRIYNGTEVTQAMVPIRTQLIDAAESAKKYIGLSSRLTGSEREEWSARAASLLEFAEMAGNHGIRVYSRKEVTTNARVLNEPAPIYTEEATKNKTTGTVVLRCIFAANGRVIAIRAIDSLPDGLTQSAIRSAQGISFVPATKDGRTVAMWMELQYTFNRF